MQHVNNDLLIFSIRGPPFNLQGGGGRRLFALAHVLLENLNKYIYSKLDKDKILGMVRWICTLDKLSISKLEPWFYEWAEMKYSLKREHRSSEVNIIAYESGVKLLGNKL